MESDTIASNRSRLIQISEGLYQHNGSGEYYARFWCKGKRIQQKLGTTESPCITLAEARRRRRKCFSVKVASDFSEGGSLSGFGFLF
jgi:hypothetical protein